MLFLIMVFGHRTQSSQYKCLLAQMVSCLGKKKTSPTVFIKTYLEPSMRYFLPASSFIIAFNSYFSRLLMMNKLFPGSTGLEMVAGQSLKPENVPPLLLKLIWSLLSMTDLLNATQYKWEPNTVKTIIGNDSWSNWIL